MNKYLLIISAFIVCLTASCNKEEGGQKIYRKIVGRWIATELFINDTASTATQGAYLEFIYCDSPPCTGEEYNQVLDSTISFTYEFNEEETELSIVESGTLGMPFSRTWNISSFIVTEIKLKESNYSMTLTKE